MTSTKDTMPKPGFAELTNDLKRMLGQVQPDKWPAMMPVEHGSAAAWFIRIVGSEHEAERPYQRSYRTGVVSWIWPYADRVKVLLHKFLKADPLLQQTIVAAAEDNIRWHGHDLDHFMHLINEVERMREVGVTAYRCQVESPNPLDNENQVATK
jgi:hypothetical protein